jgi:uncharacterized protein (TIGR03437 family)
MPIIVMGDCLVKSRLAGPLGGMMKRLVLLTAILFTMALVWTGSAQAQAPPVGGSNTIITLANRQAKFLVDGLLYQGSASFLWPVGSKHTLQFAYVNQDGFQYNDLRTTRFLFGQWRSDQSGLLTAAGGDILTFTAGPTITRITGDLVVLHLVQIQFFEAGPLLPSELALCGANANSNYFTPGVIHFAALCYNQNTQLWIGEGQFHLQAVPYPGFVFLGWKADGSVVDGAASGDFKLTGPMTLAARFSSAKRVNFRTDPPGLRVRVDRAEVRTTEIEPCEPNNYLVAGAPKTIKPPCIGEFDFAPGSRHIVAGVSPQLDKFGKAWVLDKFSTGQTEEWIYSTPVEIFPEQLITAKYTRGVALSFQTQPSGLKVRVNGRDNWPENYFVAGVGSKHQLVAPLEQTDARGRRYAFKRWSNGGSATQEVTIPATAIDTGVSLTAEYELLSQITIRSNPPGAVVTVDGAPCATPCKVDRKEGGEAVIEASLASDLSDSHRLEFASWSNGAERSQTLSFSGATAGVVTANYSTAYRLTMAGDPADGVRFRVNPATPDNYYAAETSITVTAEERPGFRFRRWDVDASGTSRTVTISMARPRTLIARMDKSTFAPIAAIRNAAGVTPDEVVAPGSLISVFGDNLASYYEVGPTGPILAQQLAGISVIVGNRILPLLFVSPAQINAQLPRDLAPGEYEMRVIRVGQLDAVGTFKVVVRAPGLFSQPVDEQPFALARHEDGSLVTPGNPAKAGEIITLIATGFGPYLLSSPEGFALPPGPGFRVNGEVSLRMGEIQPEVLFAGGVAGQIGLDQIRFRMPDTLPEGSGDSLRLNVRMDERDSNGVILPVVR